MYVSFYFVYGHPPPPRPVSNLSRVRVICGHSELNKIIIIAEGGGEEKEEEEELKVWGAFINQLTHHL